MFWCESSNSCVVYFAPLVGATIGIFCADLVGKCWSFDGRYFGVNHRIVVLFGVCFELTRAGEPLPGPSASFL